MSLVAHFLVETDLELIANHIRTNLPAALAAVSTARSDNKVPLPDVKDIFIYETAQGWRPPAVFVVPDSQSFRLEEKSANFINALSRINVTILVEALKAPLLQISSYRYQAALHMILAQTIIDTPATPPATPKVRIVIKVENSRFGAIYTNAQEKGNVQGVFRREIVLELAVEHYESLV